ncbi:MAG: bifunctional acetaldehyde-CoA/alcohol dehydrogenase [Candidatus Obscuribacterales bacterium]|nr:bifunctional acetaldehyde-CoA/alcohol dehydrogenase [Candidatus Obscuribacterales bacterium]
MVISIREQDTQLMDRVNHLARQARLAAAVFTQYSQADVDRIVKAMAQAAVNNAALLAQAAVEETRMGVMEDKVMKNCVASEYLYEQIKGEKTVGIIKEMPEDNMVEIAEPMGVILALSPVTNPTSTVIFKSIVAAKTRNSIIFSPHLMAANCSNLAAKIVYEAAIAAGAPKGFISWVEKSSRLRRETELLMIHPEVDLIFATGGTNMVKAAYSSGKPALGVGSGNTPAYVHKSASMPETAMDIIISKTFDNGTECPSEQTLIIDREVGPSLMEEFKRLGCHVCTPEETEKVANVVIDPKSGGMNYRLVGQPAKLIADQAGISVDSRTKILLCAMEGDIRSHKLAVEKLMPVLSYVFVDNVQDGINRALDINYAGGTGHTAGVFAKDDSVIEKFATAINAGRIIVNSPTSMGGLGGIYNNLKTTLSFGCGTGGGNITTDNVGISNLLNLKRVPRRRTAVFSLPTTKNIYNNPGSIDHLRNIETKSVFVLTTKSAAKRGHLSAVLERLPADSQVEVFDEVGVEPDWQAISKAIDKMRQSKPDTIIALGGGSIIDSAKLMRLFYDTPNLTRADVDVNFLDFRYRIGNYPQTVHTQLIAIPTTSGTGSEVTPFAVFKDNETKRKISLVDKTLVPNVAIIDPNLTRTLPRDITVDTAIDALTHSLEALVSFLSTDYTDGLALEAMRLIFEALPEVLKDSENIVWRHKLHNAASMAGMAIGGASVGINHALAHALGATFHITHGKANGVFLLSTIAYNSGMPNKITAHSSYNLYVADKKYAKAAQYLGLATYEGGHDTKEGVLALQRGVYDLLAAAGQPSSISELGISPSDFQKELPNMIKNACADISARTNPRTALVSEVLELFMSSYPKRNRP